MLMWVPGVTETSAQVILLWIGIMDIAIALGILLPWPAVARPLLLYAAAWGFITAAARLVTHLTGAEAGYGVDPWLFHMLVRLPHALLPLAAFAALRSQRE
jgi:hypothetical protein